MQVKATAKFIHMSPRKTRLVVDLVRGLPIEDARRQLMFSKKAAAKPVLKTLNSAIANARNNFDIDTEKLFVSLASVNEGPTIKRFAPRARGTAATIRYRMSHITIGVDVKEEKGKAKKAVVAKGASDKVVKEDKVVASKPKSVKDSK